jgi:integrase
VTRGISWPALNQTVCALRFFQGVTLGLETIPEPIAYAREPRKLPIVLNADEVVHFLEAVSSLKTRAALTTAYAAGLRASDAVSLKVADIDSGRMVIRVEQGKGGKGRTVTSSIMRRRRGLDSTIRNSCLRGWAATPTILSDRRSPHERPASPAQAGSFNHV